MVTLHAEPVADPEWPEREASAYADWWLLAEHPGAGDPVSLLSFAPGNPQNAATDRSVEAPGTRHFVRRKLPLWQQALPPETIPPDHPAGGSGIHVVDLPMTYGDPLPAASRRPPAVMVIIDTAINPVHAQFRTAEGPPRILAHWLMEARYRRDGRVPFGREIRQTEIDLAAALPEDTALRILQVAAFDQGHAPRGTAQRVAHGTHVLALAAGTDVVDRSPQAAALREVPILAVSLPSNRLLSASGVFLEAFVDQALEWVSLRLGEMFAQPVPVVVNLSYGLAAGPKDGSGYLNARIRDWLHQHRHVQMFLPAGNDGQAAGHAVLSPAKGKPAIGWLVHPSDRFSTHAEVWCKGDPDATLVLTPPGGASLRIAAQGAGVTDLRDATGRLAGRVYALGRLHPDRRPGFLICLAPTRPLTTAGPRAPSGVWQIAVEGTPDLQADVHLQSERSLDPGSRTNPPGRLVALTADGAAPQRPGTLNALGAGTGAMIINGTDQQMVAHIAIFGQTATFKSQPWPEPLAQWTSRGVTPAEDGLPFPADRSRAVPGIRAAGYRSGSSTILQGTSFSTALASRAALTSILTGPEV